MGVFSWITSDTGQSVSSNGGNAKMILPCGGEYVEMHYEGYGRFGGIDFFEMVAHLNGYEFMRWGDSDKRSKGLNLYWRYRDAYEPSTPDSIDLPFEEFKETISNFEQMMGRPVPDDKKMKDMWEYEIMKRVALRNKRNEYAKQFVINLYKFPKIVSLGFTGRYEDVPNSKECPDQGYVCDEE